MSDDIARFMYQHKISTATLAGHGIGARVALAFSCYHLKRVTGFVALDYAPLDYRYSEPFRELITYVNLLKEIDTKRNRGLIERDLFDAIKVKSSKQFKLREFPSSARNGEAFLARTSSGFPRATLSGFSTTAS